MSKFEFFECETCQAKPGSPSLCAGCIKNRETISELNRFLRRAEQGMDAIELFPGAARAIASYYNMELRCTGYTDG